MMMKRYISKIAQIGCCLAVMAVVTSCDKYLDKLPDDRAIANTPDKITKLVTSAYPLASPISLMELSSDNVTDNGKQYTSEPWISDAYRFKDITSESYDSPRFLWNNIYRAVASANEAIKAIDDLGNPENLKAQRAEAQLCRAFGMFQLATVFCMAYDPTKSEQYLGLPYPTEPEQSVDTQYERGTLEQLYVNINKDIEEALPNVDESIYKVLKYHFNIKAAYAFAARFNLYYQKWDKVITYASKALGASPADCMRDRKVYETAAGIEDYHNLYIRSSEPANFLLLPANSVAGRVLTMGAYTRYAHNMTVLSYDTYWAHSPWNPSPSRSANCLLWSAHSLYGNNTFILEPKMEEIFEYEDKVALIGQPHIVDPIFTGDETILCRAEAYVHKGDYTKALADMNIWGHANLEEKYGSSTRKDFTEADINTFMGNIRYAAVHPQSEFEMSIKKQLHPQGFTVASGTQENMIQLLLYMRRVTNMFQGLRFMDLKRYGIEYEHALVDEDPLTFTAGDLRGAIQLPSVVVAAGLQANPR